MIERLSQELPDLPHFELLSQLQQQRAAAKRSIVKLYRRLARKNKFPRRCNRLVRRISPSGIERSPAKPSQRLEPLVAAFFDAEPQAGANMSAWHAFRIRGKALRYGLELLAPENSSRAKDVLSPLVELQDRLGSINDITIADDRLRDFAHDASPADRAAVLHLIAQHKLQLADEWRDFEAWYFGAARAKLHAGARLFSHR